MPVLIYCPPTKNAINRPDSVGMGPLQPHQTLEWPRETYFCIKKYANRPSGCKLTMKQCSDSHWGRPYPRSEASPRRLHPHHESVFQSTPLIPQISSHPTGPLKRMRPLLSVSIFIATPKRVPIKIWGVKKYFCHSISVNAWV